MDQARRHLKDQQSPVYLTNQEVIGRGMGYLTMEAHLAVIEGTLTFLVSEGLLKEPLAIDYHKSAVESDDQD